jgi:hypothetical protein
MTGSWGCLWPPGTVGLPEFQAGPYKQFQMLNGLCPSGPTGVFCCYCLFELIEVVYATEYKVGFPKSDSLLLNNNFSFPFHLLL